VAPGGKPCGSTVAAIAAVTAAEVGGNSDQKFVGAQIDIAASAALAAAAAAKGGHPWIAGVPGVAPRPGCTPVRIAAVAAVSRDAGLSAITAGTAAHGNFATQ
jgi:hypothetical protein